MSSLSSSLMAKNSFRKRDVLVHVGASLVARAAGDDSKSKKSTASANKTLAIDCGYFQGFDVPAVLVSGSPGTSATKGAADRALHAEPLARQDQWCTISRIVSRVTTGQQSERAGY